MSRKKCPGNWSYHRNLCGFTDARPTLWWRANTPNLSFRNFLRWPISTNFTLRSPSLVCKKFTGNCLKTAWGSNKPVSLRVHTTLNEETLFQLKFIYIHTSFSSLKCTYIVSKALNFLLLRSRIDSCVCDEMSHSNLFCDMISNSIVEGSSANRHPGEELH